MPGFDNGVMFADNVDFTGSAVSSGEARVLQDGELLIGSAVAPRIRVGFLTSTNSTIAFTFGNGTIAMDVSGAVSTQFSPNGGDVVKPLLGNVNIFGSTKAAGIIPVSTLGDNTTQTLTVQVQFAQAFATSSEFRAGLASFKSTQFAVDANGYVSFASSGVVETFQGDTGLAVGPNTSNTVLVKGGAGATVDGDPANFTLTINAVEQLDLPLPVVLTKNKSHVVSSAGIYTLPTSPAQGSIVKVICNTTGVVTVAANAANLIRMGSLLSAPGGNLSSTAIGNCLTLSFNTTSLTWFVESSMGNWNVN
jgi:hypothetical protein